MVSSSDFFQVGLYPISFFILLLCKVILDTQLDFFEIIRYALFISLTICLLLLFKFRYLIHKGAGRLEIKAMMGFSFVSFSSYCYGYLDLIFISIKYNNADILAEYAIVYRVLAIVSLPLSFLVNYMTKDVISNSYINKVAFKERSIKTINLMLVAFFALFLASFKLELILGIRYPYVPVFLVMMFVPVIFRLAFCINILNLQYCHNGYKYSLFTIIPFLLGSMIIFSLDLNIIRDIAILMVFQSISLIFIYFSTRKSINYV